MDADLTRLDGGRMTLRDYRGKVVLLNVWAVWAGPSRQEIHSLVELQKRHESLGLRVVGLLTTDNDGKIDSVNEVTSFRKRFNINYDLVFASDAETTLKTLFEFSQFHGVPQSFVIDREGGMRGVFKGGGMQVTKAMTALIEKVIAEK